MKTLRLFFSGTFLFSILLLTGCDHLHDYDNTPPSKPRNISTITGDNRVDLYWDNNPERDVAGYNVYYSYTYNGKYTLIGSTQSTNYIDDGAKNGTTYYYAVSAYDYDGNESDLSEDVVYDTPRPEGFNQAIFDYNKSPNNAGYDFSKYLVLSYNDTNADIFFENYNGTFYLNVWDDSDLQDMGPTQDIWDISYAPTGGWIPVKQGENVKYTQAIVGNTYVIWTWDNHFAKVRIKNITNERMVFDWAYQLVEGNRELKRGNLSTKRNLVPDKVERKY
jgi:hypothetical protein